MQEADEGVIEHNVFDALTLERMLQFIYQGDYTVKAATMVASTNDQEMSVNAKSSTTNTYLPPHLRNGSPAASNKVSRGPDHESTVCKNAMIAHVHVYAIPAHYAITDLMNVAPRKFFEVDDALNLDDFLKTVKAVYSNTKSMTDGFRVKLTLMLLDDHSRWMFDNVLVTALANDAELHEFSVAVTTEVFKRSREQTKTLVSGMQKIQNENARLKQELADERKRKEAVSQAEKARADKAVATLKQVLGLLDDNVGCRNCSVEFNVLVEKLDRGNKVGYMLRCLYCRARHIGKEIQ